METATNLPEHTQRAVWHAARGSYQEGLLHGYETCSDSDSDSDPHPMLTRPE